LGWSACTDEARPQSQASIPNILWISLHHQHIALAEIKAKPKIGGTDSSNAALLFRRGFQQLTPDNKRIAVELVKLLNRLQRNKL